MPFAGSLDEHELIDILDVLAENRASGGLNIECRGLLGIIYLDAGDIYYATVAPAVDNIGQLLVEEGVISAPIWENVIEIAGSEKPSGEVLLRLEGVKAETIKAFVGSRIEDALITMMRWQNATFELVESAHEFGPVFHFSACELVNNAQQRFETRESAKPSSLPTVVRLEPQLEPGTEVTTISKQEWQLLGAMTHDTTISNLATQSEQPIDDILPILVGLRERGLLQIMQQDGESGTGYPNQPKEQPEPQLAQPHQPDADSPAMPPSGADLDDTIELAPVPSAASNESESENIAGSAASIMASEVGSGAQVQTQAPIQPMASNSDPVQDQSPSQTAELSRYDKGLMLRLIKKVHEGS